VEKISRRAVLVRGIQLPLGGAVLWGLSGCGGGGSEGSAASSSGPVCAHPSAMSDAEASTRQSLGYVEKSANPQEVCSGCSFFHAGASNCGTCDMFTGGPVNPQGYCRSWNKKAV
jgi:High potential iron-sulfur protein